MHLALRTSAVLLASALPALADEGGDCRARTERQRSAPAANPAPAGCAEAGRAGAMAPRGDREDDEEDVDTQDIFGFTKGSSVMERGNFELSGEAEGAFGKRSGRYRAGSLGGTFALAPLDRFNIELGLSGNRYSIQDVPGLDDRRSGGLGAISTELTWQAIKRGGGSPVGVALIAEPEWIARDDGGERGRGLGLELRIALDTELLPKRIFAALNLLYGLESFRPRGTALYNGEGEPLEGAPSGLCLHGAGEDARESCVGSARRLATERSSLLGLSGAIAYQIVPDFFLGGELRYLRSYSGLGLNRFEGHAVFAGPTLYAKLSDKVSLSAAFSSQIAGKAKASPGRMLDLDDFTRHQARLKISYEF